MSQFRMTRSVTLPILVAVICLQNFVLAEDAQEYLLRYKFREGQEIRYEVSLHDDYVVKIGDLTEEPHSYQDSVKSYRVISVAEDGSAVLELKMEWAALDLFQNGAKANFDSREDMKPEELFRPIASMIGKPHLRLTISPTGKVSNLNPLLGSQEKPGDLAVDVLVELPEKPVKVGSIWTENMDVPLNLPNSPLKQAVKVQRRYFLRSVSDGVATITVKTKVLTPLNDPELELQLIRRQPQGSMQVDLNRGLLISRTLTQDNEVVNFGNGASHMQFKQKHTEKVIIPQIAEQPSEAATR